MSFNNQRFPAAAEADGYEDPQGSQRPRRGRGPPMSAYDGGRAEGPRRPRVKRAEFQEPEGRTTLDISPETLVALTNLTQSIQTLTMVVKGLLDAQDPPTGRR